MLLLLVGVSLATEEPRSYLLRQGGTEEAVRAARLEIMASRANVENFNLATSKASSQTAAETYHKYCVLCWCYRSWSRPLSATFLVLAVLDSSEFDFAFRVLNILIFATIRKVVHTMF